MVKQHKEGKIPEENLACRVVPSGWDEQAGALKAADHPKRLAQGVCRPWCRGGSQRRGGRRHIVQTTLNEVYLKVFSLV